MALSVKLVVKTLKPQIGETFFFRKFSDGRNLFVFYQKGYSAADAELSWSRGYAAFKVVFLHLLVHGEGFVAVVKKHVIVFHARLEVVIRDPLLILIPGFFDSFFFLDHNRSSIYFMFRHNKTDDTPKICIYQIVSILAA